MILLFPSRDLHAQEGPETRPPLSQEEMEKIREVLARVWDQMDVRKAREEVLLATDRYRQELKKAVEEADPSLVPLMERMHKETKSAMVRDHRRRPKNPLPSDPIKAVRRLVEAAPGFHLYSDAEQKVALSAAEKIAGENIAIQNALQELKNSEFPSQNYARVRRSIRDLLDDEMSALSPSWSKLFEESREWRPPGIPKRGMKGDFDPREKGKS